MLTALLDEPAQNVRPYDPTYVSESQIPDTVKLQMHIILEDCYNTCWTNYHTV